MFRTEWRRPPRPDHRAREAVSKEFAVRCVVVRIRALFVAVEGV
ncbi:hypothetical protein T02_4277 [Trichinella nativa]|uniref:Uncharacterized protein n=1 Tax=Trichinella nativa TaxID=6335 RepID=A0A0V1KTP1_9BILA|nr:hypothetical protein T02_4277 [Trichinella nativa]